MPAKRLSMRKIKEVLRLKFELGFGHRQIARSCGINHGTVSDYIRRAAAAGVEWPLPEGVDEPGLEARLFHRGRRGLRIVRRRIGRQSTTIAPPQACHGAVALAGVQAIESGWICLQPVLRALSAVERKARRGPAAGTPAGEKLFVDYAGPKVPVVDSKTGTIQEASIFVAVLGASNYTSPKRPGARIWPVGSALTSVRWSSLGAPPHWWSRTT